MENSGSDTESECFESAEESLDECEETKIIPTKTKESESLVAEAICDNVGSAPQLEKDVSGNLMSYRKRPERVKRSNSNKTANSIPKLPSPDIIFRSDKIVPDAFFQDITNNLSKNINKSLSKLQQKSSNVKDLILNSLPVSSVDDDEGFSYDDDTVQVLPVESIIPTAKADSPNKSISNELIQNVTEQNIEKEEEEEEEEEEGYGKEMLVTETNSAMTDSTSGCNKERKPPDIRTENPEDISENLKLKGNILFDKVEGEVNSFIIKETQDVSNYCINKEDGESYEDKGESLYELGKESLQISSGVFSNYSNIKTLQEDEIGASNNEINIESVNFSDQTNGKKEMTEAIPPKSEGEGDSEQNSDENFVKSAELNQSSFVGDNLIFSEHKESKKAKRFGSLGKNDEKKLSNFQRDNKVDSNCNLEELKTALENIVKDKENSSNENNEKYLKDGSHEEKIEVKQSSSDGWEDFDFSDDEDSNVNKTGFGEAYIKEKGHKLVVAERSVSNNIGAQPPTNTVNKSASGLVEKELRGLKAENKEDLNLAKKPKQVSSVLSEAVTDDTWDWEDDWGETSEDKNDEVTDVTESPKTNKIKDESSDISKWSGWDTFAQKPQEKQGSWSLGSWGVDMLLNKATAVTVGISNVLEAGLGAPDPGTLARMEKIEREKLKEEDTEENQEYSGEVAKRNSLTNVNLFPVSGITSLVAGVTSKIVEHSKIQEIGSKVITGGLDTLETFGKKTMEVLQEGDPGLKNKRALLMGNNKPVLSQVLREAREKADREMRKVEEREMAKKCHFETLFDDFQGMVHLEALEMLSRQCELKLEQIRSGMNSEEQEDLDGILEEVEQLCSLDECELDFKSSVLDFKTLLQMAVEPLKNEISVHKIIQIHDNVNKWLETSSEMQRSLIIVNQKLVSTLAELAAATVQQFHKSGELLSVKECRQTVKEVDALSRLTNVLCTEINRLCERFMLLSRSKSSEDSDDGLNSMNEKVTLVMNNSTSYIRQAFDLLIPVIQLGAAV